MSIRIGLSDRARISRQISRPAVRQHQVEDDDIHRLACVQREAARPAFRMNDAETRLAEVLAEHPGKAGIIFDQAGRVRPRSPSTSGPLNRDASAPTDRRTQSNPQLSGAVPVQHFRGIGQRLRDAFARGFRQPDLLARAARRQYDRWWSGQERDRLGARDLRFSRSVRRSPTAALAMLAILTCWPRWHRARLPYALPRLDAIVDLRRRERAVEDATAVHPELMPG